ncbi:MAG: hypothetical protein RLZZ360_741 [Candidatus Parcubacteria bacterium]|jgi:uncharacterized membrane protein
MFGLYRFRERKIVSICLVLWCLFVVNYFFVDSMLVKTIFGFPLLVVLPGFLFLQTLQFKKYFDWLFLAAAVGASLAILMLFGLITNAVMPSLGIIPLRGNTLICTYSILLILLSLWPLYSNRTLTMRAFRLKLIDWGVLVWSLSTVVLAVIGALRLNNDLGGSIALVNLYSMAALMVVLAISNHRIRTGVLISVLYFQSLALLLMTSLRGWDIVGHDIQREFNVFQMTRLPGVWSIDYLQDAYNACMSITILPTMMAELLSIPDIYIYKILFQVIFALVPILSFIVMSRFFPQFIALLGSFLIVSFPTFFTDMSMLNRQEIAFLMFMVLVSIILDKQMTAKMRSLLIIFFGVGIILSHYSTTYIVIIFLMTAWCGYWFLRIGRKVPGLRVALVKLGLLGKTYTIAKHPPISFFVLFAIVGLSFAWSSYFTQTSDSSIKRVLARTYDAVLKDSESARSTDTLYSVFLTKKMTPEEVVQSYKDQVVVPARARAPEGTYYTQSNIVDFAPTFLPDAVLPLTNFGEKLTTYGINVFNLNHSLKFNTAKLLQLFMLLGLLSSLFTIRFYRERLPVEYLFMSGAGILFLAAMVVIPVLSVEYGVLRAFQQSLFLTAPYAVMGILSVFFLLSDRVAKILTTTFVVVFFLTSTGSITQTTGGYKALLHLNDSGPYYDYYYIHDSEVKGLSWLNEQAEKSENSNFQSEVQTDRHVSKKVNERSKIGAVNEIFPSLTRRDSFVFLGYANVTRGNATIFHNGTNLNFVYPRELIDIYKNKVYDSEGVIIYR